MGGLLLQSRGHTFCKPAGRPTGNGKQTGTPFTPMTLQEAIDRQARRLYGVYRAEMIRRRHLGALPWARLTAPEKHAWRAAASICIIP